jgi:CheY-like chemotaxis protein/predicted transcriptional regulator
MSNDDDLFDKILEVFKEPFEDKTSLVAEFKPTRYACILWLATYLKNYKNFVVKIDDYICFNYYRLGKVAEYIGMSYDRGKQARKIYEDLEKEGEVRIFIKDNKTYVCLTDKGRQELRKKLEEISRLKNYRSALRFSTHTSNMVMDDTKLLRPASINKYPRTRLPKDQSKSKRNLEGIRLLCVDDEPDVMLSFKDIFEGAGFKVDGTTDPLVALSKFKADVYDIVLLDIKMPGLNGLELYERFMQINNKVVVFFVTAYDIYKEALEQLFPNLSKDFFIMKPIDIAGLIQ